MMKKAIPIYVSILLCSNVYADDFKIQMNPLHYAASINEVDYVSELIKEEPKLASQFDKDGMTPIHIAIYKNNIDSLKSIFKEKINPNIRNSKGLTSLSYAVKLKKPQATSFLLSVGANPKIKDYSGYDTFYYLKGSSSSIKKIFKDEKIKEKEAQVKTDASNLIKNEKMAIVDLSKDISKKINKENDLLREYIEKENKKLSKENNLLKITINEMTIKFNELNKKQDEYKIAIDDHMKTTQKSLVNVEKEIIEQGLLINELKAENEVREEMMLNNVLLFEKLNKEIKSKDKILKSLSDKILELKSSQILSYYSSKNIKEDVSPIINIENKSRLIKEIKPSIFTIDSELKDNQIVIEKIEKIENEMILKIDDNF